MIEESKVLNLIEKLEFSERKQNLLRNSTIPNKETRALEPTFLKRDCQELLRYFEFTQKNLNYQKNLISKITKILRENS